MELQRIERALREGPVDEPRYEPGGFGRRRPLSWALFAGAVTGALMIGVMLGLAIHLVRQPSDNVGAPAVDLERLGEELSGSWMSGSYTEDDFVDYMTDAGHTAEDVVAFLEHDPIPGTVRWGLDFDGRERLVIFRTLDESRTGVLSNLVYELLPDGRLRLIDGECSIVMTFSVEGEELTFEPFEVDGCVPETDSRIAFEAFFGLAPPYQPSSTR